MVKKITFTRNHKLLKIHDEFDIEGQGQGHQLETRPKPLTDQTVQV